MSRHWRPEGKIVRIRPAGDWTSAASYSPRPRRGFALAALGGAVAVGLAAGVVLNRIESRRVVTPAVPVATEIMIPEVQADVTDAEWAGRAAEGTSASTSTSSARTGGAALRFGYCHTGGGTNCVVDGDTFYIEGQQVRIAGIDAPETHPPRCAHEGRLGDEATQKLQALLNSGAVTMTGIDRDRDTYGRLLRNVHVGGQDGGEALISAGVAREYGRGRRGWC